MNPRISKAEAKFLRDMSSILRAQFISGMEHYNIVNTMYFDWVASKEWADQIYKATHDMMGVILPTQGVLSARKVGVTITDFIDRPSVQHAIRRESMDFARAAGNATRDKLRSTLVDGVANGESIPELSKRVGNVFGYNIETEEYEKFDVSRLLDPSDPLVPLENWRAERIARTETAQASTLGDKQGWKETGVVQQAQWSANENACPFCLAMNGRVIDLDKDFFHKGATMTISHEGQRISMDFDYRAVSGPPLHPNCVCGLLPIIDERLSAAADEETVTGEP
jgi:predicted heme/steroid binding protein